MSLPIKCPICGTYYETAPKYELVECAGVGCCPARKAGERPNKEHVLCACNQKWLHDNGNMPLVAAHGYDHCTLI
jgi:hypothetical protein